MKRNILNDLVLSPCYLCDHGQFTINSFVCHHHGEVIRYKGFFNHPHITEPEIEYSMSIFEKCKCEEFFNRINLQHHRYTDITFFRPHYILERGNLL